MERPRVWGSDHELYVLQLAVSGPLSCVVEMPGDDLLQRGGGLQRLEVEREPPHASERVLALIRSVPVGGDGAVPPQIPLVSRRCGSFTVVASDPRRAVRQPVVPGLQPRDIAYEQPDDQRLRLVDHDLPTRSTFLSHFSHLTSRSRSLNPQSALPQGEVRSETHAPLPPTGGPCQEWRGAVRLARHHLLPGLAPVVDEVAEAVVVVVDVGVRRAMMSHREQFQDVADDPGCLADDDYAENLTPAAHMEAARPVTMPFEAAGGLLGSVGTAARGPRSGP